MSVFIDRSIEVLARETRKRSLKDSCKAYLADNSARDTDAGSSANDAKRLGHVSDILAQACETEVPRVVEVALDCYHKLVVYGYLDDQSEEFVEGVIRTVCQCAELGNDAVDLQIVKVLLSATAGSAESSFCLQGPTLLRAIRTCYNIVLLTESPVNKATAKASLTQMLSTIASRVTGPSGSTIPPAEDEPKTTGGTVEDAETVAVGPQPSQGSEGADGVSPDMAVESTEDDILVADDVEELGKEEGEKFKEVEQQLKASTAANVTGQTNDTIKSPVVPPPTGSQKDALVIFRALCRLSIRHSKDSLAVPGKILAMEILEELFIACGAELRRFVCAALSVRQILCTAILRNSLSPERMIATKSTSLFGSVFMHSWHELKTEIGILYPHVVLRPMESAIQENGVDPSTSASDPHRSASVKLFATVGEDGQRLVDMFANYDCDMQAPHILERSIRATAKLALGKGCSPHESYLALTTLVTVLRGLSQWMDLRNEACGMDEMTDQEIEEAQDDVPEVPMSEEVKRLEEQRAKKATFTACVSEFNEKPKKGIASLIHAGFIQNESASIASFLKSTTGLDLKAVGDYLGEGDDDAIAAMHAYVESFNFEGLLLDDAIRQLLTTFRLPGEAQKIDRVMEKLAEKYCKDNPAVFQSADTAYVLAFSVIMLNTDAHNPLLADKMTKEEFVINNTGISETEDVPVEYLEQLYDRIQANEIKLHHMDDKGSAQKTAKGNRVLSTLKFFRKQDRTPADSQTAGQEESAGLQALIDAQQKGLDKEFISATDKDLLKPILESVGDEVLEALSIALQAAPSGVGSICVEGFRHAAHLSCHCGIHRLREVAFQNLEFATRLVQPTLAIQGVSAQAVDAILRIGKQDANLVGTSWMSVLRVVSRLDGLLSNSSHKDYLIPVSLLKYGGDALLGVPPGVQLEHDGKDPSVLWSTKGAESLLDELHRSPEAQEVGRIFSGTIKLDGIAILDFTRALCNVSSMELCAPSAPRLFSMQKLVEVGHFNMARIRLIWTRVWSLLGEHFLKAAAHSDQSVAMYAIDSLRQLAAKFLSRAELTKFAYQSEVLRPFATLVRSGSPTCQELAVHCVGQICESNAAYLRSGWRIVFACLMNASTQDVEAVVLAAQSVLGKILYAETFQPIQDGCAADCINCLLSLANNGHCDIVLVGKFIRQLAAKLAVDETDEVLSDEESELHWSPLLAGLTSLSLEPHLRSVALSAMFDILLDYGHRLPHTFWERAFKHTLIPLFDPVRHEVHQDQIQTWLFNTAITCLGPLLELLGNFLTVKAGNSCFSALLQLLYDLVQMPSQELAALVLQELRGFINTNAESLDEEQWAAILQLFQGSAVTAQPRELLNTDGSSDSTNAQDGDILPTSDNGSITESPTAEAAQGEITLEEERAQLEAEKRSLQDDMAAHRANAEKLEEEIRYKCILQLMLAHTAFWLHETHRHHLSSGQHISLMRMLRDLVGFAAAFNSLPRTPTSGLVGSGGKLQGTATMAELPMSLIRQEVEGGSLYVDALKLSLEDESEDVRTEAQLQLTSLYTRVLTNAAEIATSRPALQQLNTPASQQWLSLRSENVLRSPMVVKVIQALGATEDSVLLLQLPLLITPLSQLINSEELHVRRALAELFGSRLDKLLPSV
mmetsp:Transcript_778/g.2900  ORF Transcript_778/g.2900 Transcript_778/m.2900 type:complete len:1642 (+) Transcript_778:177-5102(+)